jgi:hypothetical protein
MTTHSIVTLSNTTSTLISPNGTHSGCDITIQNINESGFVYVGGSGVTTSSYGYRISSNSAISFELPGYDALFLVASSNGLQAAVITMGLEAGE